jgi:hypothetical protein
MCRSLLLTHDNLAMQSVVCLRMVWFRAILFGIQRFIYKSKVTLYTQAPNLRGKTLPCIQVNMYTENIITDLPANMVEDLFFYDGLSCKEILKANCLTFITLLNLHISFSKVYLFQVYYYGSGYIALKGRMTEEE